ncbi:AAA family ATPase [Ureibacillus manganicus]|uniref:Uncharacterized protein n=1 Tax=Ureibacillus manganicus DSM 26584 TaxID=1384049 RepID=A0A0A3HTN4_9BACL|nr:hypothetical protein [Ureibacillus manganicus]KGR73653.1 hypothetical protein CD29_19185 [Ureibacillus manganicus DSM 26584]
MDGQILANSLVTLKGTELRMVYSLLFKTNIGDLLSSKTKDLFSKEKQDHFTKHLEDEVSKLAGQDDAALQVDLFLELTKLLKLRGTKYTLTKEIEDQCSAIVDEVYGQYQKKDKQFRAFTEGQNLHSTKLQQMIQFQMSKMFSELDGSFQDFTIEDQTKFASQVNDYIQSLPEEKQAKIKEKLGINDLSDEMVRAAIATSGTSIVFAIIVEVSGFAFYTTATSLVASFAGLFGLTLPFGFYTGLTSTIAVLASPFFIIPLLLGGGVLLVNHQNNSLKKKLLPIIVMQIALPYMSEGGYDVEFGPFIKDWEKRYDHYQQVKDEIKDIEAEQLQVSRQINEHRAQINHLNSQIANQSVKLVGEKQKIRAGIKRADLNLVVVSPSFNGWKNKYYQAVSEISRLKNEKRNRPIETGFFNKIGSKFKEMTLSFDISGAEKKLETIVDEMVLEVLHSNGCFLQAEREQYVAIDQQIHELKTAKQEEEAGKKGQEAILADLKSEHQSFTRKLKQLEKEHYGLADISTGNEVAICQ